MTRSRRIFGGVVAGLAGGLVWVLCFIALWGPAQAVLADPARQSEKFLRVFAEIEPLPRMVEHPSILYLGPVLIAVVHGLVFAWIGPALPGRGLGRGLRFGVVAWALAFPWFEFYLPWNVMREPAVLVAFELGLWLLTMLAVGATIGAVFDRLAGNEGPAPHAS